VLNLRLSNAKSLRVPIVDQELCLGQNVHVNSLYALLNDALSVYCIASVGRMIGDELERIWKDAAVALPTYYLDICMEILKKTT
jgi:hypothetical protein